MSGEREIAAEDSIKVVCRFRPLNDSEEKAGSKFVVKFPSGSDDNCISIAVSTTWYFAFFLSLLFNFSVFIRVLSIADFYVIFSR